MTELLTELPNIQPENFRFQNQKCLLTYRTHLPKDRLREFLFKMCKHKSKIYIAHENGVGDEVTPYEHTHVVCNFGFAKQSKNARFLDFEGVHPHISLIKTPLQWKKACKYITKEDDAVVLDEEDMFDDGGGPAARIWAMNSLREAMGNIENIRDALATRVIWEARGPRTRREPALDESRFYKWQHEMLGIINTAPDDRSVFWIYDLDGGAGKTKFCEWATLTRPEKCLMFNNVGRIADFAQNMKTALDEGWDGDTIFLNLSRSYAERTHIYEALEMIKDGYITATKYTGGNFWLPRCHVVVFANFEPDRHCLSNDRWMIYEIASGFTLRPVTLRRGRELQLKLEGFNEDDDCF